MQDRFARGVESLRNFYNMYKCFYFNENLKIKKIFFWKNIEMFITKKRLTYSPLIN